MASTSRLPTVRSASRALAMLGGLVVIASGLLSSCQRRASASTGAGAAAHAARIVRPGAPAGVIVELFTSEGCSSCPSADRNLATIVQEVRQTHARVFALSFHVDYWNDLGWQDPFSSAAYSQRQREYARAFHQHRVYTPQMIVNGAEEFVGSDVPHSRNAIARALATGAAAAVEVSVEPPVGGAPLVAHYRVDGDIAGATVRLALIEAQVSSRVAQGENAGRTIEHVGVVRGFESVPARPGQSATWQIAIPANMNRDGATVLAFVQDAPEPRVLGIGVAALPAIVSAR